MLDMVEMVESLSMSRKTGSESRVDCKLVDRVVDDDRHEDTYVEMATEFLNAVHVRLWFFYTTGSVRPSPLFF